MRIEKRVPQKVKGVNFKDIFGMITLISTLFSFFVFTGTLLFDSYTAQLITLSITVGFGIGLILNRLNLKFATLIYMTVMPPTMFGVTILLVGGYFGQGVGIATTIFLSFILLRNKPQTRKIIITYSILNFVIPTLYINYNNPILGIIDLKYDEVITFFASLAWLSLTFLLYDETKTRNYTDSLEEKNEILRLNEIELNQAQKDLESKNKRLHELNRELNTKNRKIEEFTHIVTHDLKTPLNNITAIAEELEKNYLERNNSDAKIYLKHLKGSTFRMTNLVKGLLQYAQIGDNENFTQFDTDEILQNVLEDISERIKKSKASVDIANLPVIIANKQGIRMIFQNLIDNALKFIPKGTKPLITIRSEKKTGYHLFSVKDNGLGIPKEQQGNIFEAFSRLNNQKDFEGSGIGLFGCKRIIDLHKGRIWVESEENNGSTFFFTINSNLGAHYDNYNSI